MKLINIKKYYRKAILTSVAACLAIFTMSCSMVTLKFEPNPSKSIVQFKIRNLGKTVVGTIGNLKGKVSFDPSNIKKAKIDATVDVSSINTGIKLRNKHLQAKEYFNAQVFPNIKIHSNSIRKGKREDNIAKMDGILTIKGIEKPLNIDFKYVKLGSGYILSSKFEIKRRDFNLGSKKTKAMKDKIEIHLDIVVH
jgi:polyisoprenoid-binding protein YceI